jgi:Pyruvate dehydrogenase complex, dehydrogenase (E1) component
MQQVLDAAAILEKKVSAQMCGAPLLGQSFTEMPFLATAGTCCTPVNRSESPFIQQQLKGEEGVFVSANDWVKLTAGQLAPWMPRDFTALGTDGFGLSDSRQNLRDYFEISPKYIAFAAVRLLHKQGKIADKAVKEFMKKYGVESEKVEPMTV